MFESICAEFGALVDAREQHADVAVRLLGAIAYRADVDTEVGLAAVCMGLLGHRAARVDDMRELQIGIIREWYLEGWSRG